MMLHTETAFLLRDGCSTIPQAFDTLDLIAEGAHDLSKEKAEQILNDVAIVARALEWFIAHHVYMMDVVVQEISKRYEAELLKHPEDAGPQEKISPAHASAPGRNDLCPCGSGKKFKKCCGL
jgi:uncharacterized protein YecA (UPF0149 family)